MNKALKVTGIVGMAGAIAGTGMISGAGAQEVDAAAQDYDVEMVSPLKTDSLLYSTEFRYSDNSIHGENYVSGIYEDSTDNALSAVDLSGATDKTVYPSMTSPDGAVRSEVTNIYTMNSGETAVTLQYKVDDYHIADITYKHLDPGSVDVYVGQALGTSDPIGDYSDNGNHIHTEIHDMGATTDYFSGVSNMDSSSNWTEKSLWEAKQDHNPDPYQSNVAMDETLYNFNVSGY